ncbi:MAG: DUF1499 domain-containing protein [Phenylobacterium sp.]|uniref:DUF1499 domain-containing protein n=1 Tax=Phenylobacterium sp. TaxID=1871053 RepID=UPI0025FAC10F|nr:DUF1499 domain-containing protein [Phenylobacterium sp.]MCA6307868.1 DUF1499 domain-containing protein [Phenylobacterium sp.]MCA6319090.1 DUF1499 domain-containing protein [Phenylobacterium sp.]
MRLKLAQASMALSLLLPFYFMVAALGVKFDLWSWRVGLLTLILQVGLPLFGLSLILGLVALVASLVRTPRTGWKMALVGLLIPLLGLGYAGALRQGSGDVPPIHDVTTDIADPPAFSAAVMAARAAVDANPVNSMSAPMGSLEAYKGPEFSAISAKTLGEVGRGAYPDLRPLSLPAEPSKVAAAAVEEAKAQGWTLVTTDPAAGVIEATAETFWFGFEDDVAIRVRPSPTGGSIVDVRSTSRVGLSDLGANAKRIEAFLAGLKARMAAD